MSMSPTPPTSAVDVFDPATQKHLYSIPGLTAVAGALVSDESQLVFTSNRGENTIGVFAPGPDPEVTKIAVGVRPNGLAYDARRRLVLAANVGDPAVPHSYTLSMVDLDARALRSSIEVPGRTRWTVFDADAQAFYVNIMQPSQIVVVDARQPDRVARTMPIPADGAHGLDFDPATRRLFCACDAGVLVTLDAGTGKVLDQGKLSGRARRRLVQPQAPAALCRGRRSQQYQPQPSSSSSSNIAAPRRTGDRPCSAPTSCCGSKIRPATRSPSRPTARRDRSMEARPAGLTSSGGGSDGAVQHEDLGGCVRLDVVRTHERHHGAFGQALDRLDQAGSHGLLKGPADLQDLGRPAGLDERLLGVGHAVVQEHDDQLAVDRRASLGRPPAGVL